MEKKEINKTKFIDDRKLSIIVFSLFFSWLLAFPFEGSILYALADYHSVFANQFIFGSMVAHLAGLLLCSFFIKTIKSAKRLMLISIVFCMAASSIFFFSPSILWKVGLLSSSLLAGACVAAWSFFLRSSTQKSQRIKTIADGLIWSNILMIILNIVAINISPKLGLTLSILILTAALLFALKLPHDEGDVKSEAVKESIKYVSINKTIAFLCLFIVVITINSGLMYQVQVPAFEHIQWFTSWYWAIPYIIALFVMRNLSNKTNRAYILYVAIAMIGFSFIAFMVLQPSVISYVVVNTLMLGACGVYDLFWWSILGEMLEFEKNPARILGMGLSANVLGVLLGGLIGNAITSVNEKSMNPTLLALGMVCVTLVMLPPLHKQLTDLMENHVYLIMFYHMPPQEQTRLIRDFTIAEKFTERESQIASLLTMGKTYRAIAGELHVSENTVKTHVKNIYSKAGVQSRTELINVLMDIHPLTEER